MAAELASLSFSLFFSVNRAPLVALADKRAPIFDAACLAPHRWHPEVLLSRELA
ncbi:MAG TPA: hypothetical protein VF573_15615 [Paraburkholderia sp.]|uniref:hypothetical protein n=1 Tax=Paraburkholderia sp. TaxID=1926495 RepID=UPI002ED21102